MSENASTISIEDVKNLGVSPGYIEGVFKELAKMDVPLEADPLAYGPKYLAAKIARCRNYLSRTEQIYSELSFRLSVAKRLKLRAEAEFSVKEAHLLTNDPTVRSQRSVSDRKAQVVMQLVEEMKFLNSVSEVLQDLDNTLTVVKSKRADLKDIQGRIRDQMKLCQEMVALGSHWGSKLPPGQKSPDFKSARGYAVEHKDDLDALIDSDDRSELTDLEEAESSDLEDLLASEKPEATGSIAKMRKQMEDSLEEDSSGDPPEEDEEDSSGDPPEEDEDPSGDPPEEDEDPSGDPPEEDEVAEDDLQDFLDDLGVTEDPPSDPVKVQKATKVESKKSDPSKDPVVEAVIEESKDAPNAGDTIFEGREGKTAKQVEKDHLASTVTNDDVDSFLESMEDNLEPDSALVSEEINFDDLLGGL